MKINLFTILVILLIFGCSDDDKNASVIVTEGVERGSVLRTIDRVASHFTHQNFTGSFEVEIEEQSITDGNDLDFVRLYLKYIDRASSGIGVETAEVVLGDIQEGTFINGPDDLPRTIISFTYQEAIDALGLEAQSIMPGDQFELRTEVFLTNNKSFSNDSASASILTDFCFFASPYRYVIPVIAPISDNLFGGSYTYEVISEGDIDFFANSGNVNITTLGESNVRRISIGAEGLEFTISGPHLYPKIYSSFNGLCRESGLHILLGPAENTFGNFDPMDDTVFEFDFIYGYEGWGGLDQNTEQLVTLRLVKQ